MFSLQDIADIFPVKTGIAVFYVIFKFSLSDEDQKTCSDLVKHVIEKYPYTYFKFVEFCLYVY